MASSIPSTITCFSTGLSHLVFPITMLPGQPQVRVGPLTSSTVSGSIALLPIDPDSLTISSISSVHSPESSQMLRVQYKITKGTNDPAVANLSYLTEGITWEPSYVLIANSSTKTLRLTGRATILSNLPFLDDCSVPSLSLVSGNPSIVCKGKLDSLVSGGGHPERAMQIRENVPPPPPPPPPRLRSRSRALQRCNRDDNDGESSLEDDCSAPDLSGHSVASFYHYNIKNVPFNHQLPTSMAFMEDVTNVSFMEIYKIDLEAWRADNNNVPTNHYLEFPTSCSPPLPRGPVMVLVRREQEHQEDLLAQVWLQSQPDTFSLYITESREVLVKLAISTVKQKILKNEEKKKSFCKYIGQCIGNHSKERILLETIKSGRITMSNRKKEEVNIEIKHTLRGQLITSQPTCADTVEKQNVRLNLLNPENLLTWKAVVPAEGKEEIVFEYSVKEWKDWN
jgi:hypothetical protein